MKATDVRTTDSRTATPIREPQPPYEPNGQAGSSQQVGGFPETAPTEPRRSAPEPRPVTAASARRGRLWEQGILVLEREGESLVLGPIDEALVTESVHSSPWREPEEVHLRPEQELIYVPSGPVETGDEFPPLHVRRRRTIVRVRPDTAGRYGDLYKLLTAAECRPEAVGEDLARLTWALAYGSITAAKKAERILRGARRLAAE